MKTTTTSGLTRSEAILLAATRTLADRLANDGRHNHEARYAGFVAAKAEAVAEAIFDLLNTRATMWDDEQARSAISGTIRQATKD